MSFDEPKIRQIKAARDTQGEHFIVSYASPGQDSQIDFKARLISRAILTPGKDMQAMFQIKFLLENEYFDITIDHNFVDSYFVDIGSSLTTYIRLKVKSKIMGSSLMLGWFSLAARLETGFRKLTHDINQTFR